MIETQNTYHLLNPVIEIAKKASFEVLKIYSKDSYEISEKEDKSPLTTADIISNRIICEGLSKISNFPIISEENAEISFEERSRYEYFWMIDPIDGTKEFIKKNGEFTINIALIKNKKAVLGVVLAPVRSEIYYAVEGYGAYLEKNNMICRLQCTEFRKEDERLRIPISMSFLNEETLEYMLQYKNHIRIPKGAALKFMMVANGGAEIYPRLAPTMEWDTAAPQIIVEEAGGMIINLKTNERMEYNKQSLINPNFVTQSRLKT